MIIIEEKKQEAFTRLQQCAGTPLHTIIEKRLVCRADWETYCGAVYPRVNKWIKKRDGRMIYTGDHPRWEGKRVAPDVDRV